MSVKTPRPVIQLIEKAIAEKATFLNLGNRGLTAVPPAIVGLADCIEHLNFNSVSYFSTPYFESKRAEFAGLGYYVNYFDKNINSLYFLENLPHLKKLELAGCSINNTGAQAKNRLKQLPI